MWEKIDSYQIWDLPKNQKFKGQELTYFLDMLKEIFISEMYQKKLTIF